MKTRALRTALAVAGLLLSLSAAVGESRMEKTLRLEPGGRFSLDTDLGSVTVTGTSATRASLSPPSATSSTSFSGSTSARTRGLSRSPPGASTAASSDGSGRASQSTGRSRFPTARKSTSTPRAERSGSRDFSPTRSSRRPAAPLRLATTSATCRDIPPAEESISPGFAERSAWRPPGAASKAPSSTARSMRTRAAVPSASNASRETFARTARAAVFTSSTPAGGSRRTRRAGGSRPRSRGATREVGRSTRPAGESAFRSIPPSG
jgi:hypothetical protein